MQLASDRGKLRALAISLGLHIATFSALMYAPPISLPSMPPPSPSEYQQAFAGKEDKIVWYKFRELPNVTPQNSPKARQPLRAAVKAKQAIVSSPKNAPKRDQVVVTPAPAIELPPLDLPNLIAVKLPPKQFTTPPDLVKPETAKIELPDAAQDVPAQQIEKIKLDAARLPARPYVPPPTAKPESVAKIDLPDVPAAVVQRLESAKVDAGRLPPRPYVPPKILPKPSQPVARIEAPSDAPRLDATSTVAASIPSLRLPARAFVPPTQQAPPERGRIGAASEAATVEMNAPVAAGIPGAKLPARAFAPPPAVGAQKRPSVAAPLPIDGPAGDVTMAIAGLNPSTTPVKLPPAASPAQFSAGEKVRPDGAASDGAGKGIVVSDLYAHAADSSKDAKPNLLARTFTASTTKELLDDVARRSQTPSSPAVGAETPHAAATRVSNAPDPRFNGRDVYMMAIQMPNLTSAAGHWLMWYAARTVRESELQPIAAPVPHHKVDPKYNPAARDDHVEGRVQLFCVIGREGNVSSIELIRGADERLNKSAEEALAKWEFYPATRNGEPVDVDVVVEIPFVLAAPPLK